MTYIKKQRLIRKTWMISKRQLSALLHRVAKDGISESEVIRRALDAYFFQKRRDADFQLEGKV